MKAHAALGGLELISEAPRDENGGGLQSRDREGLPGRGALDEAPRSPQGGGGHGDRDVAGAARALEVGVDVVGEDEGPGGQRGVGDGAQLLGRPDATGGIVRVAQEEQVGAVEGALQRGDVDARGEGVGQEGDATDLGAGPFGDLEERPVGGIEGDDDGPGGAAVGQDDVEQSAHALNDSREEADARGRGVPAVPLPLPGDGRTPEVVEDLRVPVGPVPRGGGDGVDDARGGAELHVGDRHADGSGAEAGGEEVPLRAVGAPAVEVLGEGRRRRDGAHEATPVGQTEAERDERVGGPDAAGAEPRPPSRAALSPLPLISSISLR